MYNGSSDFLGGLGGRRPESLLGESLRSKLREWDAALSFMYVRGVARICEVLLVCVHCSTNLCAMAGWHMAVGHVCTCIRCCDRLD